jgi:hypothetical protein
MFYDKISQHDKDSQISPYCPKSRLCGVRTAIFPLEPSTATTTGHY